jgi:hypothetical protein
MPRGTTSEIGEERTSANGYRYVRTEDGWRFKHHIIAEKKLGRALNADERVIFKDKDRKNLKPENIEVVLQGTSSLRQKKARLEARIAELQAELAEVNKEIQSGKLR